MTHLVINFKNTLGDSLGKAFGDALGDFGEARSSGLGSTLVIRVGV